MILGFRHRDKQGFGHQQYSFLSGTFGEDVLSCEGLGLEGGVYCFGR